MKRPRTTVGAFSLIELLIAMSLGLIIVFAAFASFRVATQSVTISNRLATENSLMRSGYFAADDNLDFWTDLDEPNESTRQLLRRTESGKGLAFAPLKNTDFASANQGDVNQENHRGWESNNKWAAHDPATWWRGNLAESYRTDLRMGYYSIFANTSQSFNLKTDAVLACDYGDVNPRHSWLYNQLHGTMKGLLFYGCAEYMPSNAIYGSYMPHKVKDEYDRNFPQWNFLDLAGC